MLISYAARMLGALRRCHYRVFTRINNLVRMIKVRTMPILACLSWVAPLPCAIMEDKVTLGKIIVFLRIYLTFGCCWPLPSNATKLQRFLRTAFRYFCCANSVILSVAAAWTLYKHSDDALLVMKLGCQFSAVSQVPLQIILFAFQDKRLQV